MNYRGKMLQKTKARITAERDEARGLYAQANIRAQDWERNAWMALVVATGCFALWIAAVIR